VLPEPVFNNSDKSVQTGITTPLCKRSMSLWCVLPIGIHEGSASTLHVIRSRSEAARQVPTKFYYYSILSNFIASIPIDEASRTVSVYLDHLLVDARPLALAIPHLQHHHLIVLAVLD
jgi:hypothetical protein